MADDNPAPKPALADWLRLQRSLVRRSAEYVQTLGELIGQGSFEPGEYIEQTARTWAGVARDFGEWLAPGSQLRPEERQALICLCAGQADRHGGAQSIPIRIPVELFGDGDDPEAVVGLAAGSLVRFDPEASGRPPLVLEPGKHVVVEPNPVTRTSLDELKLRVYDLSGIGDGGTYEGLVWATQLPGLAVETRLPVAVVVLELT